MTTRSLENRLEELRKERAQKDEVLKTLRLKLGLPQQLPKREVTYIMVKPDGIQRGLVGKVVQVFEKKGFKLVALKMMTPTRNLIREHYDDLKEKPYFEGILDRMTQGPVVGMVWEGDNVVKTGRKILGATMPLDSNPGTLRGGLCVALQRNAVHGSDSVKNAEKEIALWFPEGVNLYDSHSEHWVYDQ